MVTRNVVRSGITRNVVRGVTESFFSGLTPQLHYEFATNKTLVATIGPTLSITRTTDAKYRDSSGVVQTASSGNARFDHDASGNSLGLLVEEARTNIALHSNDWTNAVYDTVTNITPLKDATGPDGVANSASTLTATADNGVISQSITAASAARTTSVWMKRKTGTGTVEITDNGFTNATDITADINSSTWTQVGNITRTQANPVVGIRLGTSGDEVEVAYLQCEAGSFSTSPIETTTASVTRNADVVSTTDTSWQTAGVGTFCVNFELSTVATGTRYVLGADSSANKRIVYNQNATIQSFDGSAPALSILSSGATADTDYKVALSYADAVDNYDGYINGSASSGGAVAYADAAFDVATTFVVGDIGTGGQVLNGHIAEIRYYNTRLTNAQLEDMSNGVFP